MTQQQGPLLQRPRRFTSHALVEIRKFKKLPFFCRSAVLLDLSLGGFKLEFTGEHRVSIGDQFWLFMPLEPLGIYSPKSFQSRVEVRWFDQNRFRIGGVFMKMSRYDQQLIEQIVHTLREKSVF